MLGRHVKARAAVLPHRGYHLNSRKEGGGGSLSLEGKEPESGPGSEGRASPVLAGRMSRSQSILLLSSEGGVFAC